MMKLHLICAALSWVALSQAYVSRMTVMNRIRQGPLPLTRPITAALRPGVVLQRPWVSQHVAQDGGPHRPYVIYRQQNLHSRYAPMKPYGPTRSLYTSQWRATRPFSTTERGFIRASGITHNGGSGGIHTVPAPNLSLREKPIVVVDASSEKPKIIEVTEKYPESPIYQTAKIEQPIGFSKPTAISGSDIENLIRNGASFQLTLGPESGFSTLTIPQAAQFHTGVQQPTQFQQALPQPAQFQQALQQPAQFQPTLPQPTQFQQLAQQSVNLPVVQHQHPLLPQQFSLQQINTITTPPEMVQARPEGIVISPSALYQPDPAFLQKLQNQLLQRFPGIEFVPYVTEFTAPIPPDKRSQEEHGQKLQGPTQGELLAQESQIQVQTVSPQSKPPENVTQTKVQHLPQENQTQSSQSTLNLLLNEQIIKQTPSSFVPSEFHRNIVQRQTPESTVTLLPVISTVNNVTEIKVEAVAVPQPENFTTEHNHTEPRPTTTTIKYIQESSTAHPQTTPIYYAQVGQSVGNVIASGIYSAINDVRAAVTSQQDSTQNATKPQESITETITSTSTINPDFKPYFVQINVNKKDDQNTTTNEIQPVLGAPFKAQDSIVAYSLVRADDKENKITSDGSVYAGQLVEASVSEDQDFNRAKAKFSSRRAPIRLVTRTENKEPTANQTIQNGGVVKARIPPRSKLTFDDKTGEPVLRIYASYVDSPSHKELIGSKLISSKLTSSKRVREAVYRKQDPADWKEKAQSNGDITQFGVKLRSRSDDYVPLFDDYQD